MAIKRMQIKNPELITTPNRVLEVIGKFSAYQLKIYATIIELLQDGFKKSFKEGSRAVSDFIDQDVILLSIPLQKISKPSEYREVKRSLLEMSKINCEITYSKDGQKQIMSGSLFTVDMPTKANRRSNITIRLHPQVARLMLTFQRNEQGKPIFYSKFDPEIVRQLKSKNIIKFYFFLCLWRNKRRITIRVDRLYEVLGLGSTYSDFTNFKKHILLPASKALANYRDVWVEIKDPKDPNVFIKDGINVVALNLDVMTQAVIEDQELKRKNVVEILKAHYRLTLADLEQIKSVLEEVPYLDIMNKIHSLHSKMTNKIEHPNRYIVTALLKEFPIQ